MAVAGMTETADPQLQPELIDDFNWLLAEVEAPAAGPLERLLVQDIAIT
jgi:hypothetical protein